MSCGCPCVDVAVRLKFWDRAQGAQVNGVPVPGTDPVEFAALITGVRTYRDYDPVEGLDCDADPLCTRTTVDDRGDNPVLLGADPGGSGYSCSSTCANGDPCNTLWGLSCVGDPPETVSYGNRATAQNALTLAKASLGAWIESEEIELGASTPEGLRNASSAVSTAWFGETVGYAAASVSELKWQAWVATHRIPLTLYWFEVEQAATPGDPDVETVQSFTFGGSTWDTGEIVVSTSLNRAKRLHSFKVWPAWWPPPEGYES